MELFQFTSATLDCIIIPYYKVIQYSETITVTVLFIALCTYNTYLRSREEKKNKTDLAGIEK